jgi:hypothetical protein
MSMDYAWPIRHVLEQIPQSELLDEAVCSLSKTPESSEGDGREVARSMSFGVSDSFIDGGTIKESANGGCALEFTLDTPSMLLLKVAHGK